MSDYMFKAQKPGPGDVGFQDLSAPEELSLAIIIYHE